MAAKRKRGLSKGLDALLSSNEAYQRQPEEARHAFRKHGFEF